MADTLHAVAESLVQPNRTPMQTALARALMVVRGRCSDTDVARPWRQSFHAAEVRRGAVAGILLMLLVVPSALANGYAGWSATYDKLGIKGYVKQPTVSPITSGAVLSWLGICGNDCQGIDLVNGGRGFDWVQLGVYQGVFSGGSSTSTVHMYYENQDPCGDYYADDIGAPPSQPYRFVVWNDGSGSQTFHCSNGVPFVGYSFSFRKGDPTNPPFFYGVMTTDDGRADAVTEWHGPQSQGTIQFGCSSTDCDSTDYAIYTLQPDGSWLDSWSGTTFGPDNPPYRHTYHNYWAFKTCQLSC